MIFQTFEARLGRFLFAGAWLIQGILCAVLGLAVIAPLSWPASPLLIYGNDALVALAALGLMWAERAKLCGTIFAILALLWALAVELPRPLLEAHDWSGFGFCSAIFGASWVLAAMMPPHLRINLWDRIIAAGIPYGRVVFALSLLAVGATQVASHEGTMALVPEWVPARGVVAYLIAVVPIAGGLAILSGIVARPAAIAVGVLYAGWAVLLEIPRAIAGTEVAEWMGVPLLLVMSASAFIVSATFLKPEETVKV